MLAIAPLKKGIQQLMNQTGAPDEVWPWACKYIAQVNNICATPVHGWKTPISIRHGYTPDISAYLQFQFWEKVYFKVDEQSPGPKEAAGYWLGVSETVGDLMTFDIWTEATKRVIQRSAVRTADPAKGGFPNLRVTFHEDQEPDNPPQIVEPENLLDKPGLMCPPQKHNGPRTRKHKVKWHETVEAPEDYADEFSEFKDAETMPPPSENKPDQNARSKWKNPIRSFRKIHLIAASACMSLASKIPIVDSGCNLFNLESTNVSHDNPFIPESKCHILETRMEDQNHDLNHEDFILKMQLQYFDIQEDRKK